MQILELLARESALLKDRHLLAGEIKFLREQLNCYSHHQEKLYSYRHHQVDDILNNMTVEENAKNKHVEDHSPVPSLSPKHNSPSPTHDNDDLS